MKDGVRQRKWCVWQSFVWKTVCVKVVCERWCVTNRCVKDAQLQKNNVQGPKMPCRDIKACHLQLWLHKTKSSLLDKKMSLCATPATQSAAAPRATNGDQACHQEQLLPRLPRKTKVDVAKCNTCHVKPRWMSPCATPAMQSAAAPRATNGDQARHLPRKTKVDAAKCHACHVKPRWMSPCATPATQSAAPPRATNGDQARHQVQLLPHLPRQTQVDVAKCHACHVKRRWMSPSATPATQSAAAPRATNGDQARHQVQLLPRLPRQTQVDVAKCHACHVKRRWMSPSATPVAKCHACHVKPRWMSPSATPATQSARATNGDQARHQVELVPPLPRKTKVDVAKCHACHVKRRWVSPSAPPATQSAAAPGRPTATKRATKCNLYHAFHAKPRSISPSATNLP